MPENLHRCKPATVKQAMSDVFPTLATVRKYHSGATAKGAAAEIIGQGAALLNVGKNLQPHQIEFIADEILREYYYLTIGEIRYIVERGVRGEYGTNYDRFDVQTVFEWIEKYLVERTSTAEQEAQAKPGNDSAKWREWAKKNGKPMPESVRQALSALENKYLVDGEAKQGVRSGEFEPDTATLEMIRQEWETNEGNAQRQPFENYKTLRIAQLKAMMKK